MDITALFMVQDFAVTNGQLSVRAITLTDLVCAPPGRDPEKISFPVVYIYQGRTQPQFKLTFTVTNPDGSQREHILEVDDDDDEHGIGVVHLSGTMVAPSPGRFRLEAKAVDRTGGGAASWMEYDVRPYVDQSMEIPKRALESRDRADAALDDLEIRRVEDGLGEGEWIERIKALATQDPLWVVLGLADRVTTRWRESLLRSMNAPPGAELVGDFPPEAFDMMDGKVPPQIVEACRQLCDGFWSKKDPALPWHQPIIRTLLTDPAHAIHTLAEGAYIALLTYRTGNPATDVAAILRQESVYRSAENALAIALATPDEAD